MANIKCVVANIMHGAAVILHGMASILSDVPDILHVLYKCLGVFIGKNTLLSKKS